MSTLQRSSYSFRRQGSSGRIWDNRLPGRDIKAHAADHEKVQENRSTHNDIDNHSSPPVVAETTSVPPEAMASSVDQTPSRSGNKAQKCALGAIFGRCARPSAS
ncbi:hypothetical protein ACH5RR_014352 [Cinchona calisaya]|uniref:Uncharacterized protein n=1 Tax=Cinchona calisaya TaxID=153742 RepID=A0ABD3A2L7_9GENT